jgi:hypothetical protein
MDFTSISLTSNGRLAVYSVGAWFAKWTDNYDALSTARQRSMFKAGLNGHIVMCEDREYK